MSFLNDSEVSLRGLNVLRGMNFAENFNDLIVSLKIL